MADLSVDEFGLPNWEAAGAGSGSLMNDSAGPQPTPEEMALAAIQNRFDQTAVTPMPALPLMPAVPPIGGAGMPQPGNPDAAMMSPDGGMVLPPGLAPPGMTPPMGGPPGQPMMAPPEAQPSNPNFGQTAGLPVDPYALPPGMNPSAKPMDPYAGPRQPGPPGSLAPVRPGDINAAGKQQEQAISEAMVSGMAHTDAQLDAQSALALRKAGVINAHAEGQLQADTAFAVARQVARKDAERDTAQWMAQMEKKAREEPAPSRWFESQNSFGKIMWTLSLAFGAIAQSKAPGMKNVALEMITAEIDADMGRQKAKLERQMEVMKKKGANIDQKLQNRLADAKDDHTLLSSRLLMIQNSALERANAPGAADQKAAWMGAAKWAAEKRLEVAGARVEKTYAQNEGALNRQEETRRAVMVDQRSRSIALMENQRAYDLAQMSINAKSAEGTGAKFKDTRVLPPQITGIRVLDAKGQPIQNEASKTGGLVVSEKIEKEVISAAHLAQERYATLARVEKELDKDEDWVVLLKRNPRLQADIMKLGYQTAKEADPRGIVTDKDLANGLEMALGGDLSSLSGRIAAGTFSAGQADLKEIVKTSRRNMPKHMSNMLGAHLDASIPGYEGDVRVDWTPKNVEQDEAGTPSPQQTSAKYGLPSDIKPPLDLKELERAQTLEKQGKAALPPYKPGVEARVKEVLADLDGLLPGKVTAFAESAKKSLEGDQRAVLEVEQARLKQVKVAETHLDTFKKEMKIRYANERGNKTEVKGSNVVNIAVKLADKYGLTQVSSDELVGILESMGIPTVDTDLTKPTKTEYK